MVNCDNAVTVNSVNSGCLRDLFIQNCLRELHIVLALHSCEVRANFIFGQNNRIADALSRWSLSTRFSEKFYTLTKNQVVTERTVNRELWKFCLKF